MPKLKTQVEVKPSRLFLMWKDYSTKDSEERVGWKLETNKIVCTSLTPSESSLISTLNRVNGAEQLYWYVIPVTRKGERIKQKLMRNGVANGLPCFKSPLQAMSLMNGRRRALLNTPFQLLAVYEKAPKATKKGLFFSRGMVICSMRCSLTRGKQKAMTAMNIFRTGRF